MPEGHLLHRYAAEQHDALTGRRVRATSPQGTFDAAPYDGCRVEGVEPELTALRASLGPDPLTNDADADSGRQ